MGFLRPTQPPAVAVIPLPSNHHIVTASSRGRSLFVEAYLPAFRALPSSQRQTTPQTNTNDHYYDWFRRSNCEGCAYNVEDSRESETDDDGFYVVTRRESPCRIYYDGLHDILFDSPSSVCAAGYTTDMDDNEDYQDFVLDEEEDVPALSDDDTPGPIHPPIVVGLNYDRSTNATEGITIHYSSVIQRGSSFYASARNRAQNTYSGGGVCWNNNVADVADFAGYCNAYRKSAFNYDLTTPSHERHCLLQHKYFVRAARIGALCDLHSLKIYNPVVSTPQDKANALLTFAPRSDAELQLRASGFPTTLGVIPLAQYLYNDIPGWVTPRHPDYGHRWFVATPPDSSTPVLVGQIND